MKHLVHSVGFRWLHLSTDGVGSVIIVVTLRRTAIELLGLFSPLYVLGIARGLGYSIKSSFLVVIGYFLLLYLAKILTMPLAENTSFRIGYRRTLILSTIPFFLFVGLLVLSQSYPILLIFVALFWGVHAALFWFGYHGLFVKRGDYEHFGKQTGLSQAIYIAIGVVTPIFGGLVVLKFGYQALFLAAGAIFALGVMVALLSKEIRPHRDARIVNVIQLFKTHKKVMLGYFGWGLESALYGAVWPVFLFLLVGKILAFGEIVSAAVFMAAIITYLIGLVVDRIGVRQIIGLGSIVGFLTWTARVVVRTPLAIVGVDGLYRVTEQMLHIPLLVRSYQKAIDGGTGQTLYFMEISLGLGAITALVLAAVMVFLNLPLWTIFLLASFGALAPIFITRR
jgi:MFS family permease